MIIPDDAGTPGNAGSSGNAGTFGNGWGHSGNGQANGASLTAANKQAGKISIEDIEARLRSLTSRTNDEADSVKNTAGRYTVVVLGVAVVAAYLFGRHRGRLKSAVIEIKRG